MKHGTIFKPGAGQEKYTVALRNADAMIAMVPADSEQEAATILEEWRAGRYQLLAE